MSDKPNGPIGISLGGNAAAFPSEAVPAVIALADAVKANAEAISIIARRLDGTPAVQGATISNRSIQMPAPPKTKSRVRRKA